MKPFREIQMKRLNDFAGNGPGWTRRKALGLIGGGAALLGAVSRPAFAQRSDDVLNEAMVLRDPDVPATGAGETAITVTPAAIANAIFDATGARLREAPFTPERVSAALREAGDAAGAARDAGRGRHRLTGLGT